jgi:hypothetical protein
MPQAGCNMDAIDRRTIFGNGKLARTRERTDI